MGLILVVCMTACAAPAAIPNAQALWDKGAYREAFASAIEAANAGDPHAEYLLGEAYRLGRSVEADQLEARNWYMRAARQGDVASAAALGRYRLVFSLCHSLGRVQGRAQPSLKNPSTTITSVAAR